MTRSPNPETSVAVHTPIDIRCTAAQASRAETEPVVSTPSQEWDADEVSRRRRDRRFALLLMVLSGVFVIACAGGAWFVLTGR